MVTSIIAAKFTEYIGRHTTRANNQQGLKLKQGVFVDP